MHTEIQAYNAAQQTDRQPICQRLAEEIEKGLPAAESKIWHGSPVWFLDGNPIVGYHSLKNGIRLLFWSGQSFDEPGLLPEGSFKAAEARYNTVDQIDSVALQRWLEKSKTIQWDYKNIVKRRGELVIKKPVSVAELSERISRHIKPGTQPVENVDEYYQKNRKAN